MNDKPTRDVKDLARRLKAQPPRSSGGRGRHSPLFLWMFERAGDLRPILDHTAWNAAAAVMPETDNIRDGAGNRPSAARLRKTWAAVCRAKGWRAAQPLPNRPQPLPSPIQGNENEEEEITMTMGSGKVVTVKMPRK